MQHDNERLISLTKIHELDISPPFTVLYFEVISAPSLDSHDVSYPIRQITARYQEEQEITFEGDEETIRRTSVSIWFIKTQISSLQRATLSKHQSSTASIRKDRDAWT
jgi:hypothetical protein